MEGEALERVFLDVDEDVFFIVVLIVVDIIEEMIASGDKDIHVDKYVS
ncbi:hypothetical protein [Piscirickettsia litoralis]|nr:hypothetical protein [Piscirickettsia litoralis]